MQINPIRNINYMPKGLIDTNFKANKTRQSIKENIEYASYPLTVEQNAITRSAKKVYSDMVKQAKRMTRIYKNKKSTESMIVTDSSIEEFKNGRLVKKVEFRNGTIETIQEFHDNYKDTYQYDENGVPKSYRKNELERPTFRTYEEEMTFNKGNFGRYTKNYLGVYQGSEKYDKRIHFSHVSINPDEERIFGKKIEQLKIEAQNLAELAEDKYGQMEEIALKTNDVSYNDGEIKLFHDDKLDIIQLDNLGRPITYKEDCQINDDTMTCKMQTTFNSYGKAIRIDTGCVFKPDKSEYREQMLTLLDGKPQVYRKNCSFSKDKIEYQDELWFDRNIEPCTYREKCEKSVGEQDNTLKFQVFNTGYWEKYKY